MSLCCIDVDTAYSSLQTSIEQSLELTRTELESMSYLLRRTKIRNLRKL